MAKGRVKIPTPQGGFRWGRFEPQWTTEHEVPLYTVEYAEADVLVYGSGRAEVIVLGVPIILRMPVQVVDGVPRLTLPAASRRADVVALRKIVGAVGAATGGGPGVSDAKDWPTLVEYLTTAVYPDGEARQVSSMTILADNNGWRGCLSDKDNGRVLWKTGPTLLDLLQALEAAAAEDDPSHWRQSSDAKWKGKKRS